MASNNVITPNTMVAVKVIVDGVHHRSKFPLRDLVADVFLARVGTSHLTGWRRPVLFSLQARADMSVLSSVSYDP